MSLRTTFIFIDNTGIPTSIINSQKIIKASRCLQIYENLQMIREFIGDIDCTYCCKIVCYCDTENSYSILACFKSPESEYTAFIKSDFTIDEINNTLIKFFYEGIEPDISDWEACEERKVNNEEYWENYVLYVDDGLMERTYDHITFDDVQTTLDNITNGFCDLLLLHTPNWQNGYMQVSKSKENYIVEVSGRDEDGIIYTYRTHTKYIGQVIFWLSSYFHEYKYPTITENWEDVSEEFRQKE